MICRRVLFPIVAVVSAAMLVACSGGGINADGQKLSDPSTALKKADHAWRATLQTAIDDDVATVSDDSRCYFYRQNSDESDVRSSVYCGPVRRLAASPDDSWDVVPFKVLVTRDGTAQAKVQKRPSRAATSVDESHLFRPDGAEPVKVSALEKPKAPRTTMADFAALVPAESLDLSVPFKDVAEPYRLVTPSASVAVTAHAKLPLVPAAMVALSSQSVADDAAPGYRPAAGQAVQAWRVTLGPGVDKPEPNLDDSGWLEDDDTRDASTTFAVAAGGQRLVVHGSPAWTDESLYGEDTEDGVFTVDCGSLPCDGEQTHQYVLLVSSSRGSQQLVATVDGADQMLNLSSGERAGDVSTVEYGRDRLSQQLSTTWPTRSVSVSFDWDDESFNYGGRVSAVYLTAFDVNDGWAPKGKAWLEVPIESDPAEESSDAFTFALSSWALQSDGRTLTASDSAGADWTFAFLVPDDFTKGTFTYRPRGAVEGYDENGDDITKSFRADQPLTLDISIPAGSSA